MSDARAAIAAMYEKVNVTMKAKSWLNETDSREVTQNPNPKPILFNPPRPSSPWGRG